MIGMFCTLTEAAERLQISENEVEALLERGALHEFREGPCRLVKTAEVGALAQSTVGSHSSFVTPAGEDAPLTMDGREARLPHCAAATMEAPVLCPPHSGKTGQTQPRGVPGRGTRRNPPTPSGSARRAGRPAPRPYVQTQPLSVRQWFWNGLVQDRPVAVALLSGLVLLVLSAVIGGVCWLGPLIISRIT